MKISILYTSITLALGITAEAEAIILTFNNSTEDGIQGTDFNYVCNTSNFTAGAQVRLCDPNGFLGGGTPVNRNTIAGGEAWSFDGDGIMSGVAGTGVTPGITSTISSYIDNGYISMDSSDRDGGPGLDQGGTFFGQTFSFLAPASGLEASTPYGAATYTATGADTFEIFFPVLEVQWAGHFFPLGFGDDGSVSRIGLADNAGVTFYGTVTGNQFSMWAEEYGSATEDPGATGLIGAGWTTQWYYTGTLTSTVPVPAAVWLFGSGLLSLLGLARHKKTNF